MPLRYFRRKGRTSCPPPNDLIPELYNVYRCFAQLDDPDRPGCNFFNGDHLSIFKKQIGYVQKGLLSDPPGRVMYVLVKTLTTGFEVHRCLRSTSLLEGYHLHLRHTIAGRAYECGAHGAAGTRYGGCASGRAAEPVVAVTRRSSGSVRINVAEAESRILGGVAHRTHAPRCNTVCVRGLQQPLCAYG